MAELLRYQPQEAKITPINFNAAKTFDPSFELERAGRVDALNRQEVSNFLSYEMMQMETHLGERFNVNLSQYEYDIKDGKMYGRDMDEPFEDSIRRGIERRKKAGNPVDRAREEAELTGFSKIQSVLLDPETPVGTMMLSVSPSGGEESTYQNNFYDVFTLRQLGTLRYIETKRYTSGLDIDDYREKLSVFGIIEIDESDPAAYLLANPIEITNAITPDDLHHYLHRDHGFVDKETFEIVKKHCKGIAQAFAKSLIDQPEDEKLHKDLFNSYLNKADEIFERIKSEGRQIWDKIEPINTAFMVNQDVEKYSQKEVKKVMTGCGMSGGFESSGKKTAVFSVSEFGKKDWDYHKGDCVVCKRRYTMVGPCKICKDCEKEFDEE